MCDVMQGADGAIRLCAPAPTAATTCLCSGSLRSGHQKVTMLVLRLRDFIHHSIFVKYTHFEILNDILRNLLLCIVLLLCLRAVH